MKKVILLICAALTVGTISVGAFGFSKRMAEGKREAPAHILLLGTDQSSRSTDTIILLSLNEKAGQTSVLQIPRDLYLNTEAGERKINSLFAANGIDALVQTVEDLLDISVDGYAIASPEAIGEAVDELGGIPFSVPFEMRYEDPAQDLSIRVPEGAQVLNGKDFLAVWRYRSGYADGDMGRMKTQRDLLFAVARRLASERNVLTFWGIYRRISPNVLTNLTKSDIISLCLPFCRERRTEIHFYTLPGDALYQNGISYFVLCRPATARLMRRIKGTEVEVDRARIGLGSGTAMENVYYDPNMPIKEFSEKDADQ